MVISPAGFARWGRLRRSRQGKRGSGPKLRWASSSTMVGQKGEKCVYYGSRRIGVSENQINADAEQNSSLWC